MANAKISNAAVFVPPTPPIDPATVFAAALAGANSGPTMADITDTVLAATYHDATSSRAWTTVYTNSQTVPIWLAISVNITSGTVVLTGDGFQIDTASAASFWTVKGFVSVGGSYELTKTGTAAITAWYERY